MIELCKRCHRQLQDNDKTLLGKQYKRCCKCRAFARTYLKDFVARNPEYFTCQNYKDTQSKYLQESRNIRNHYQQLYRTLIKCRSKEIVIQPNDSKPVITLPNDSVVNFN